MPEALLHELQELDLSVYEARTLLALLKLGSANGAELARHSGVPADEHVPGHGGAEP